MIEAVALTRRFGAATETACRPNPMRAQPMP